ncbi:MAG: hypothetical protein Q8R28_02125, partial [Dehalococcoidia bacterium]|nr:hypothetical protein [Dehalococcoidia bacterium]
AVSTINRSAERLTGFGVTLGTALQAASIAVAYWAYTVTASAVGAVALIVTSIGGMIIAMGRLAVIMIAQAVPAMVVWVANLARATAAMAVWVFWNTVGALQGVQKLALALLTQGIPAMAKFTVDVLKAVAALIVFAVIGMVNVIKSIPGTILGLGLLAKQFVAVAIAAVSAAGAMAVAWVSGAAAAVVTAVGAIIGALATVAIPLLAIAAVAALIAVSWANNWGDVQGITARVLNAVAENIKRFIRFLEGVPFIGGAIGQVRQWVDQGVAIFSEWVPKATKFAGDAVGGIVQQFKDGFPFIQDALKGLFALPMTGGEIGAIEWEGFASTASQVDDAIAALNAELADTADAAGKVGDQGQIAIHAMERQVDATSERVKMLEGHIRDLSSALRDAQDAMRGFSEPLLVGMGAADDAIFALQQELIAAQIEELQLGKAGQDASKEVAASFNQLAAEQAEITQGIPVAVTKMKWDQEQARRAAEREANKSSQGSGDSAERTRVQELQDAVRLAQLQMQQEFDPQLRTIKKHFNEITGAAAEITMEGAIAGMDAA